MISVSSLLSWMHLMGLALGMGAATVKFLLLLRCGADPTLTPAYLKVARPITQLIIAGLVLLTLSGIGWLLLGYDFTPLLVVKVILVVALWILGPMIDKVFEPRFRQLAPEAGTPGSDSFRQARSRYVAIEALATLLFYVIVTVWVLG